MLGAALRDNRPLSRASNVKPPSNIHVTPRGGAATRLRRRHRHHPGAAALRSAFVPEAFRADGGEEASTFVPDFSAHVATDSVRCVYVSPSPTSNAPVPRRARAQSADARHGPRRRRQLDRRRDHREGLLAAAGGRDNVRNPLLM